MVARSQPIKLASPLLVEIVGVASGGGLVHKRPDALTLPGPGRTLFADLRHIGPLRGNPLETMP